MNRDIAFALFMICCLGVLGLAGHLYLKSGYEIENGKQIDITRCVYFEGNFTINEYVYDNDGNKIDNFEVTYKDGGMWKCEDEKVYSKRITPNFAFAVDSVQKEKSE